MLLLAFAVLPLSHAAGKEAAAPQNRLGAKIYRVTHEMWLLLSGVVDKESADAAADRFLALAEESARMNDMLFDDNSQALEVESFDQDTYRIAEAYEDLSYEFESLCRTQCYGSAPLISSFLAAMRLGIFSDDDSENLQLSSLVLNENDAYRELQRFKQLREPDQDLLTVLCAVQDARTATIAVGKLKEINSVLRRSLPALRLSMCNFAEKDRVPMQNECNALEPLLWKIRTEIVRIVSLPGYDREAFDDFSDALDAVYESLGDTHSECFDVVFDASFRSDLDDALHDH